MAGTSSDNVPVAPPAAEDPAPAAGNVELTESKEVPSVEEILSCPGREVADFSADGGEEPVNISPLIGEVGIAGLREQ